MAEEIPPPREVQRDPEARRQAWRLLWPPLVFLAHFGGVYGWAGLVCARGWGDQGLGPMTVVTAGVLVLTVAALAGLWLARAGDVPPAPQERLRAYDPDERAHFMVGVTRMVAWLSATGILAVGGMGLLARTCGISP